MFHLSSRWLGAAVLGLGVATAASAQVASVNGKIAYVACGPSSIPFTPDQCDIWVMNPDGTGPTNLTNTTNKNEGNPSWSPDGTRIAYFEGFFLDTLMVMDADGANPTPITTSATYPFASRPSWSPGGTQLAFVRMREGSPVSSQADIVVIDLGTGVETVISRPVSFGGFLLDADEISPAWSPDGAKIAFAGVRLEQFPDPITGEPIEGAQWEIAIVDPDGSGEQILSVGDPGTDRALYLEEDREPAWSPDGSMLVFMSQAQIPACCGPWQIWAVNRDGSGITNLTNDETINDMFPSWSPDGSQIVFSRSTGSGGSDLYTMPAPAGLPLAAPLAATSLAATGSATPLTTDGNARDPNWGRDPASPPAASSYLLSVAIDLTGRRAGGTVRSTPAGIRCGRDCSELYAPGALVTLTASPKEESRFTGWLGACSGTARSCVVTMNDVKLVRAGFARTRR